MVELILTLIQQLDEGYCLLSCEIAIAVVEYCTVRSDNCTTGTLAIGI